MMQLRKQRDATRRTPAAVLQHAEPAATLQTNPDKLLQP